MRAFGTTRALERDQRLEDLLHLLVIRVRDSGPPLSCAFINSCSSSSLSMSPALSYGPRLEQVLPDREVPVGPLAKAKRSLITSGGQQFANSDHHQQTDTSDRYVIGGLEIKACREDRELAGSKFAHPANARRHPTPADERSTNAPRLAVEAIALLVDTLGRADQLCSPRQN